MILTQRCTSTLPAIPVLGIHGGVSVGSQRLEAVIHHELVPDSLRCAQGGKGRGPNPKKPAALAAGGGAASCRARRRVAVKPEVMTLTRHRLQRARETLLEGDLLRDAKADVLGGHPRHRLSRPWAAPARASKVYFCHRGPVG
jgi:hypothetical protein